MTSKNLRCGDCGKMTLWASTLPHIISKEQIVSCPQCEVKFRINLAELLDKEELDELSRKARQAMSMAASRQ